MDRTQTRLGVHASIPTMHIQPSYSEFNQSKTAQLGKEYLELVGFPPPLALIFTPFDISISRKACSENGLGKDFQESSQPSPIFMTKY